MVYYFPSSASGACGLRDAAVDDDWNTENRRLIEEEKEEEWHSFLSLLTDWVRFCLPDYFFSKFSWTETEAQHKECRRAGDGVKNERDSTREKLWYKQNNMRRYSADKRWCCRQRCDSVCLNERSVEWIERKGGKGKREKDENSDKDKANICAAVLLTVRCDRELTYISGNSGSGGTDAAIYWQLLIKRD